MSDKLLWIDVETTGVDYTKDKLLQVSGFITDLNGDHQTRPFDYVVKHNNAEELKAEANDVVKEMHQVTGLWSKLFNGVELSELDETLYSYIVQECPTPGTVRLAGSSCRLDLNFIEYNLPKVYSHLNFRMIDVSGLAYTFKEWGWVDGYYEKKKTHDAIDDIKESLAEYRWLKENATLKQ